MTAPPLKPPPCRQLGRNIRNAAKLSLAAGCVGWIWLIGLPWLGQWQPVRQHVDRLNAQRINASAMFYTELEPEQAAESENDYSVESRKASK